MHGAYKENVLDDAGRQQKLTRTVRLRYMRVDF